jgi:GrpB-like predicted nucleotidyltransferase (UPF0157 family)
VPRRVRTSRTAATGQTLRVDPDSLNAYLDQVLIGGRERRPIVLVDFQPEWPVRFERERARILDALGDVARVIEHIGSTAVPGLAAKPIVDILVTVADPDDESAFTPALERAGYVLRVREPGHCMFRTPDRAVQVHVWGQSDPEAGRYLTFRDRLRASEDDRKAYERLKRELAVRDWEDVNHYAQAKGSLIEAILARSREGCDSR